MNETIINEVIQGMLPYLDNGQLAELQRIMRHALHGKTILEEEVGENQKTEENNKIVDLFISATLTESIIKRNMEFLSVRLPPEGMALELRRQSLCFAIVFRRRGSTEYI